MTLYDIKPRFQALLRPAASALANAGIRANQVTLGAALISVILGTGAQLLPDRRWFLAIAVWMLARMMFNAIDGMLAREFAQRTILGGYLNELADVVSDTMLYLPFALVAPFAPGWVIAVVLLAMLSEYAGALGPMAGVERRYDGPMGKSDRALVFGLVALAIGCGMQLPDWFAGLLPLMCGLLVLTIVNRVRRGVQEAVVARPADSRPADGRPED